MPTSNENSSHEEKALMLQEIAHLMEKKDQQRVKQTEYLQQHPELRCLLNDFTAAVLLEKPSNVFTFAAHHFGLFNGIGPPTLPQTPPLLVIVCDKCWIPLDQRFQRPLMTTTRPPRHGDVPGVTINFAEALPKNEFLEIGDDDNGLVGTPLHAISRIRSLGKIPAICVNKKRALMAISSPHVAPRPKSVYFCSDPSSSDFKLFDKVHTLPSSATDEYCRDKLALDLTELYPSPRQTDRPLHQ